MTPADIDRVFGRGRLRMVTGDHVEVFREASLPGERRRYTKRFLATAAGDFRHWTEREWRILARLVGHGIGPVPDVVQFDRGAIDRPALVQTYDAGVTVDHWATLLPVARDDGALRHVFEDCAHWWALARHCLIALDAIHELQLVHLDLKADNVCIPLGPADFDPHDAAQLLSPRFEQIALIDFAFSLVSGESLSRALPIAHQADYDYQSPRLLHALEAGSRGDLLPTRQLDWRCDVFSLAAMLRRYLPDPDGPLTGAWTAQRYAQARALVRRLLEAHDAERPLQRPHAELIVLTSHALADPELAASLAQGWTLAIDSAVAGADSPTPVTRIALPISAEAHGHQPMTARRDPAEQGTVRSRRWAWLAATLSAAAIGAPLLYDAWWAPSERAGAAAADGAAPAPATPTPPTTAPAQVSARLPMPIPARESAPARSREARLALAAEPSAAYTAAAATAPTAVPVPDPAPAHADGAAPAPAPAIAAQPAPAPTPAPAPAPAPAPQVAPAAVLQVAPAPTTAGAPVLVTAPGRLPMPAVQAPAATAKARPAAAAATARAQPRPAARPPAGAVPSERERALAWLTLRGPAPRSAARLGLSAWPAVALAPASVAATPQPAASAPAPVVAPAVSRVSVPLPTPAPPPLATAPAPRPDEVPAPLPTDFATRANELLAIELPRIAQRAERRVLWAMNVAAQADNAWQDDEIRRAASAIRDSANPPLPVAELAADEARRLHEAAGVAFWRRGNPREAHGLQLMAFGANPFDADVVSSLAFLTLKQRPAQAEVARQLAIYALSLQDAQHMGGRIEDWTTLAIASALSGRDRDARNAWFVSLALAPQFERQCRVAINAYAVYGEPLRVPVEAMLYRVHSSGRAERSPLCEWPPYWAATRQAR
jgi:hypothetical protein